MQCPKCGKLWDSNMPETYLTCSCGEKFNLENGECEHGRKKGQCDNAQCVFRK